MSKKLFYTSLKNNKPANENYKHKERNVREKYMTKVMKQCVLDFCHSNEASQIDSNLHRIVDVVLPEGKIEKHVGRVWSVLTVDEQHTLFKQSKTIQGYTFLHSDDGFRVPSRTFFHKYKCKCIRRPTTQSCVDITVSTLQHLMRALEKFLQANRSFKRQLYACPCGNHEWEKLLSGTVKAFVDASCCPKCS